MNKILTDTIKGTEKNTIYENTKYAVVQKPKKNKNVYIVSYKRHTNPDIATLKDKPKKSIKETKYFITHKHFTEFVVKNNNDILMIEVRELI